MADDSNGFARFQMLEVKKVETVQQKYKQPISLYIQCLNRIKFRIKDILSIYENRNINKKEFSANFPVTVCQDIITTLMMNSETANAIPFFCRLGMKTLKIMFFNGEFMIEDIAHVLKDVEDISFSSAKCSEQQLKLLIHLLPNVERLDLSNTLTSDSVLKTIVTYCTKLEELDISHCPITDKGLKMLCRHPFEYLSKRCRRLKSLTIKSSNNIKCWTESGITYLLKRHHFHELNVHPNIQTAVVNSYAHAQPNVFLRLSKLNLVSERYLDLSKILLSTPYLRELCLYKIAITNVDLIYLPKLHQLQKFSISMKIQNATNNFERLTMLLALWGDQLIELRLENFSRVELSIIGMHCPRLQCLKLNSINFLHYNNDVKNANPLFKYLSELFIHKLRNCNIVEWKKLLQNCPNIQRLILSSSECFNDDWIFQMISCLKEVRILCFLNCYRIGNFGVMEIIKKLPDLVNLSYKCEEFKIRYRILDQIHNCMSRLGSTLLFSFENEVNVLELQSYVQMFFT